MLPELGKRWESNIETGNLKYVLDKGENLTKVMGILLESGHLEDLEMDRRIS
jgi:hypothetical protein